jgi:hypothetical protein
LRSFVLFRVCGLTLKRYFIRFVLIFSFYWYGTIICFFGRKLSFVRGLSLKFSCVWNIFFAWRSHRYFSFQSVRYIIFRIFCFCLKWRSGRFVLWFCGHWSVFCNFIGSVWGIIAALNCVRVVMADMKLLLVFGSDLGTDCVRFIIKIISCFGLDSISSFGTFVLA